MQTTFDRYLDKILSVADIRDPEKEGKVRAELADHLEEKAEALQKDGYDRTEAVLKALEDHGNPVTIGYRLRPWRWVDVRLRGTARGFLAIGPRARGFVAIGGLAVGVVAFGGLAAGLLSFGGVGLGLLIAWGGVAAGAVAYGGAALGVVAFGGVAAGVIASGGMGVGMWVPGAGSVLWSYFDWATVPQSWKPVGELFSFNPADQAERTGFLKVVTVLNIVTMTILFSFLIIQGILMRKEGQRVRSIDPAVFE